MNSKSAHPVWRAALPALVIALLAIIGLYWPTVVGIATIWWNFETYAHGMLVVPIILYMVGTRRQEVAILEPEVAPIGLVLLLLLSLGWLAADAAEVSVVQHLVLAGMLQTTVYALLGWPVTWALAFPLAYLLFAVPVGEALIPPLQQVTAWFTVEGLRLTGVPVWWEGLHLVVPSGSFEVAEACSGLRYLIASVALGFLYAYLSYRSIWRRLAFIALSIAMPIVANGIRAYGIVMIANLSDMKYAVGIDHLIYGWLFFGLVVFLMFWIGSFWREPVETISLSTPLPLNHPLTRIADRSVHARRYTVWTLAVVLAAAVGPQWANWMSLPEPDRTAAVTLQAPPAVAPWQGPEADTGDWEPKFSGADAVVRSQYRQNGQTVSLYIAYYRQQRPDAKLVSSQNSLYDDTRWRYVSEGRIKVQLGQEQWPLQTTLLTDGQRRRWVWSGYWEGGRLVVAPYVAKLWEAWDRLSGAHQGSALVAVAADYEVRPDEVEPLLREFLASLWPGIAATLQQPGGGR